MSSKRQSSEGSSKRRAPAAKPASVPEEVVKVEATSVEAPAPQVADPAVPAPKKRKAEASVDAKESSSTKEAAPKKAKSSKKEIKEPKESKEPAPKRSKKEGSAKAASSTATAPSDTAASAATAAAVEAPKATQDGDKKDGNPCISRYLRLLLKSVYADSTVSKDAIEEVQKYVFQFGLHFLIAVKRHLESARKTTLMMPDMPICLQRTLSASSLYTEFSNAMTTALTHYYASYSNGEVPADAASAAASAAPGEVEENRKKMWAARAGLSIPPTRTKEFAKLYLSKFRFSQNSITGLTALLESLALRLFKLSFEKAQEDGRKRISQKDVQNAASSDSDLQWLLVQPSVPIV